MSKNKKRILTIIILILCVTALVVLLCVLHSKKVKRERERQREQQTSAFTYPPQTHDAIGAAEGYALTPVDTAEGTVSFIIDKGNQTTWSVSADESLSYNPQATDNSYIFDFSMTPIAFSTETDAITEEVAREADIDIRGGAVGIVYHLKVKEDKGRLVFVSGSCEKTEAKVEVVYASEENAAVLDKIKLPAGAVVSTATDFIVGDEHGGKHENLLRVYYYMGDDMTYLAATDHATKDNICSILENFNLKETKYEKKQQNISNCSVNCYIMEDGVAGVWDDEGMCYITFVESPDMDKLSKKIETIITGSTIK